MRQSTSRLLRTGLLSLTVCGISALPMARADDGDFSLDEDDIPVVHHNATIEGGTGGPRLEHKSAGDPYSGRANVYEPKVQEDDVDSDSGDVIPRLPRCSISRDREYQVYHFTPASAGLDTLYYDGDDYQDTERAKSWKTNSFGYVGGRTYNFEDPIMYSKQVAATQIDLKCLPTRFRIISRDNKRLIQFREGDNAWKLDDPPAATNGESSAAPKTTEPKKPPRAADHDPGTRF